ncbi:hypothetical protein AB0A76_28245 [Streptomyces exfoliatus]|uniref:Uncharacterized protein n=1 Tax=Streptomyces exfoliatus TaxID=1905 RepID=A0ABV3D3K9_STREX
MLLHTVEDRVLHVTLPCDLDVTTRAAATLEARALIYAHRPRLVRVQLDGPDPSPASLSTLARARRTCERLGIPSPSSALPPRIPAPRPHTRPCEGTASGRGPRAR